MQQTEIYKAALQDKSQFIVNGYLDMERILECLLFISKIFTGNLMKISGRAGEEVLFTIFETDY